MLKRLKKNIQRVKRNIFPQKVDAERIELLESMLKNEPYELFDKFQKGAVSFSLPRIVNAPETLDKILREQCSLARFGDGEFGLLRGSRIHFQSPSEKLSRRLEEVIRSKRTGLLIGLPECFGELDEYTPSVAQFWRKWMVNKRSSVYEWLDMNRVYHSAFFTRVYMPYKKTDEHYLFCQDYFNKVKKLWAGRDVVICEGEGTRFGLNNDLLDGAASVRRILCPARNAFDKYDQILGAFDELDDQVLVLSALGPTATVLAYDLHEKGFQTIDIGHLDIEYEWFLQRATEGCLIPFKYVDGSDEGRQVHKFEQSEYVIQIIRRFA